MPGARIGERGPITLRAVDQADVPFVARAHATPELRWGLDWDVKTEQQLRDDFDDVFGDDECFLVCLDGEDAGPGPVTSDETE